ncbi:hypothetical protein IGS59_05320 [Janthinobacterium sp. GW460P]|uniref:hypothetical protein n=1 Tax=unclassified Janthinobacterium TaxID=2610881 RepID=UPI00111C4296|nr:MULTISPECIES: hypothetical protein [unclassified Janthinobacterium]MCC7701653.1 hypothetical protein [Janthinobacterium sp. GW460P]MCC7707160.1 hypothetical protein [Janthinobacterium sp. GW460W]
MKHLDSFADNRLIVGCIYCGGMAETREHVPSKVFLDAPLPENLPIVGACRPCNNGFSLDEEYVACLVEAVIAGSTSPDKIRRRNIADILNRSPALRAKLDAAKTINNDQTIFAIELARINSVIVKLARGHAAFELSQPCRGDPTLLWCHPLAMLSDEQRDAFEECDIAPLYGEIGSRGMQRMMLLQFNWCEMGEQRTQGMMFNDWIEVQEDRYRYHAADYGDMVRIKLVLGGYLACLAEWKM